MAGRPQGERFKLSRFFPYKTRIFSLCGIAINEDMADTLGEVEFR